MRYLRSNRDPHALVASSYPKIRDPRRMQGVEEFDSYLAQIDRPHRDCPSICKTRDEFGSVDFAQAHNPAHRAVRLEPEIEGDAPPPPATAAAMIDEVP